MYMFVILNSAEGGVKNLIKTKHWNKEILRLKPQNDIATQSLDLESRRRPGESEILRSKQPGTRQ